MRRALESRPNPKTLYVREARHCNVCHWVSATPNRVVKILHCELYQSLGIIRSIVLVLISGFFSLLHPTYCTCTGIFHASKLLLVRTIQEIIMSLSQTQMLLNRNSEAVIDMQRGNHDRAISVLDACLRELERIPLPVPRDAPTVAAERRTSRSATGRQEGGAEGGNDGGGEPASGNVDGADDPPLSEDGVMEDDDDEGDLAPYHPASVYALGINIRDSSRRELEAQTDIASVVGGAVLARQEGLCMFDEAIVTTCLTCEDGIFPVTFLRSILIYNLGLCLHQKAMIPRPDRRYVKGQTADTRQQDLLVRATLAYELALLTILAPVLGDVHQRPDMPREQDVILVLLALNNNIAHIYATQIGNIPVALQCLERMSVLLGILSYLDNPEQALRSLGNRSNACWQFFNTNLFLLINQESDMRASPAA